MMKYEIIRTDTADAGIRKIILYVAQNFGNTVALEKLNQIEKQINRWFLYKNFSVDIKKYIYIFRHIILYNCKMWQKK